MSKSNLVSTATIAQGDEYLRRRLTQKCITKEIDAEVVHGWGGRGGKQFRLARRAINNDIREELGMPKLGRPMGSKNKRRSKRKPTLAKVCQKFGIKKDNLKHFIKELYKAVA